MGKAGKLFWISIIFGVIGILSGCTTVTELQQTDAIKQENGMVAIDFQAIKQKHRLDCGAVCLVAVMNYWGINVSQQDIKKYLGDPPKGGYSLNQLKEYAQKMGLVAIVMSGTLEDLRFHCSLGRPCIVVYEKSKEKNHSVVILNVDYVSQEHPMLKLMDPAKGKVISTSADWLTKRWKTLGSPILLVAKSSDKGGESMAK